MAELISTAYLRTPSSPHDMSLKVFTCLRTCVYHVRLYRRMACPRLKLRVNESVPPAVAGGVIARESGH